MVLVAITAGGSSSWFCCSAAAAATTTATGATTAAAITTAAAAKENERAPQSGCPFFISYWLPDTFGQCIVFSIRKTIGKEGWGK